MQAVKSIDELEAQEQILIDEKSTLQAERVALGIAALAALSRSENRKSFFQEVVGNGAVVLVFLFGYYPFLRAVSRL